MLAIIFAFIVTLARLGGCSGGADLGPPGSNVDNPSDGGDDDGNLGGDDGEQDDGDIDDGGIDDEPGDDPDDDGPDDDDGDDGDDGDPDDGDIDDGEVGSGLVRVEMQADYGNLPLARGWVSTAQIACPVEAPTEDGPEFFAGLDCDGDGGPVQFITPSAFRVAVKRLTFIGEGDQRSDIIADTGTLAAAQVVDLTTPVTLAAAVMPVGNYAEFEAEFYYFELTMPLYDAGTPQTLRVYASDDDFPAEGSLGHHQGDITLIGSDGAELGFVGAGELWQAQALYAARGDINGAGGTDAQTGHLRGLYGNVEQWDQPAFAQGDSQDIYILRDALGLVVTGAELSVTFTFDVTNAWFYEDFDANGLFNACDNTADACAAGAAWSPILNPPSTTIN